MRSPVVQIEAEIARRRAQGEVDPEFEEKVRALASLAGVDRYVWLDDEGFAAAGDYHDALAALAEIAADDAVLGGLAVASDADALRVRCTLNGVPLAFELAPITTDWFDAELLARLNDALAERGAAKRFVQLDLYDQIEIVFVDEATAEALADHPLRLRWTDREANRPEVAQSLDGSPSLAQAAWPRSRAAFLCALPEGVAHEVDVPAHLGAAPLVVSSVEVHPHDPFVILRVVGPEGRPAAGIWSTDGRAAWVPEDAVDMGWSPDGATTFVLGSASLTAWIWGEDATRGTLQLEYSAPAVRLLVGPMGGVVAVLTQGADGSSGLFVVAADTLEEELHMGMGARPVAWGIRDDEAIVAVAGVFDSPSADDADAAIGNVYGFERATRRLRDAAMLVPLAAVREISAPSDATRLGAIRFEGDRVSYELPVYGPRHDVLEP